MPSVRLDKSGRTQRLVAVWLLAIAARSCSSMTVVYTDDPNWYFTEYNWANDSSRGKLTANPGAYFKVGFTGSNFNITVNATTVGRNKQPP